MCKKIPVQLYTYQNFGSTSDIKEVIVVEKKWRICPAYPYRDAT